MSDRSLFLDCCIACLETNTQASAVKLTDKFTDTGNEVIKTIYEMFLNIKLKDDNLKFLCQSCIRNLLSSFKFWKRCKESWVTLNSFNLAPRGFDEFQRPLRQLPLKTVALMFPKLSLASEVNFMSELNTSEENTRKNKKSIKASHETEQLLTDREERIDKEQDESITMKFNIPVDKVNPMKQMLTCHLCQYEIRSTQSLFNHLRQVHFKSESIECPLCTKIYADTSPRFKCLHCGDLVLNFHRHNEKNHLLDRLYKCHHCPKLSFTTRSRTADHMTRFHLTDRPCKVCGKRFENQYAADRHRAKAHASGPDFKCFYCNFSTSLKRAYQNHITQHTGVKKFPCEICKKQFGHDQALKRHLKTHTTERLFQCERCEKSFTTAKTLLVHQKVHEKPEYECPQCHKMFRRSPDLRRHIRHLHPTALPPKGAVLNKKYLEGVRIGKTNRPIVITEIPVINGSLKEFEKQMIVTLEGPVELYQEY